MIQTITAGDTFTYEISNNEYASSYVFKLRIRGTGDIDITGTGTGTYKFNAIAATTALWDAGHYKYVIFASNGTDEYTIESGSLVIKLRADLDTTSDVRTHAQKTLEAIKAVIEKRATVDQESYSISGRTLTRMSIDDLLKFRNIYQQEVNREQRTVRRTVKVRM